jgi:hypothetical protein
MFAEEIYQFPADIEAYDETLVHEAVHVSDNS